MIYQNSERLSEHKSNISCNFGYDLYKVWKEKIGYLCRLEYSVEVNEYAFWYHIVTWWCNKEHIRYSQEWQQYESGLHSFPAVGCKSTIANLWKKLFKMHNGITLKKSLFSFWRKICNLKPLIDTIFTRQMNCLLIPSKPCKTFYVSKVTDSIDFWTKLSVWKLCDIPSTKLLNVISVSTSTQVTHYILNRFLCH